MAQGDLTKIILGLKNQDRRALAQAITIFESMNAQDKDKASKILQAIKKPQKPSLRLSISGPPGVGKSTFINALGQSLLKDSLKIAIVPIDPASPETKGSILADKTRMRELINEPDVYIRPSSSRGVLGGVSLALSDVLNLVEGFGFDVVIIETVGVGQSEMSAYALADFFLVLMQPGSGDALSAMKKGIMERADFLVVNKADGELSHAAKTCFNMLKAQVKNADIFLVSSLSSQGINDFKRALFNQFEKRCHEGTLISERLKRFDEFYVIALKEILINKIKTKGSIKEQINRIKIDVTTNNGVLLSLLDRLGEEVLKKL